MHAYKISRFLGWYYTNCGSTHIDVLRDGILTAQKIMEVMLEKNPSLAKLAEPVTIYRQILKNIYVKSKPEARADMYVTAFVYKVSYELGANGRILVRESGKEPVIRVMVEKSSKEL